MTDLSFTESERERLCVNVRCREHGHGTDDCRVPRTTEEAARRLDQRVSARPKEASASVEYSE